MTHTHRLKLNGKLNIIQQQQWPAEGLLCRSSVRQNRYTLQTHWHTHTGFHAWDHACRTLAAGCVYPCDSENISDGGQTQVHSRLCWLGSAQAHMRRCLYEPIKLFNTDGENVLGSQQLGPGSTLWQLEFWKAGFDLHSGNFEHKQQMETRIICFF